MKRYSPGTTPVVPAGTDSCFVLITCTGVGFPSHMAGRGTPLTIVTPLWTNTNDAGLDGDHHGGALLHGADLGPAVDDEPGDDDPTEPEGGVSPPFGVHAETSNTPASPSTASTRECVEPLPGRGCLGVRPIPVDMALRLALVRNRCRREGLPRPVK